jgi:hypothetical protein
MAEIKKTLAILKARWPEVILIIGLIIFWPFLSKLRTKLKYDSVLNLAALAAWFSLVLMIIAATLRLGFLRTVYLEGQKRQSIAVLLRTGFHFLWRMIVLGSLYFMPLLMLTFLSTRLAAGRVTPGETDILHNIVLIRGLLVLVITIILMKFILLIPALVIVLDCRAFESFKFLKNCRLRDARELIVLFCFQRAFSCLWLFFRRLYGAIIIPQSIFSVVYSVTMCFIGLIIAVMAVRFVASLNLMYDNQPSSLDFEDWRK